MRRHQGFTLTELLVTLAISGLLAAVAASMSLNSTDPSALTFSANLDTLLRTMPSAARRTQAPVTLTVTNDQVRLSTGAALSVPTGLTVTSTLTVTPTAITGTVTTRAPRRCEAAALTPYGTVSHTPC